jgi:hypothetical protein
MLAGERAPGVYLLRPEQDVSALAGLAQEHGLEFFRIDGREVVDKTSFLRQVAEAMDFPPYFGQNWDALDECITDLEWRPANGYVIFYDSVGAFAQNDPEQWQVALDILRSAVDHWQRTRTPMFVLLRGSDATSTDIPSL